jgi:CBS domain containing-hemolysin-like protein
LLFITVTSLSLWATGALLTWQTLSAEWPLWVLIPAFAGVLFIAEVLPLLIAARNPENVALMASGGVRIAMKVLAPVLTLFGGLSRAVSRLFGAHRYRRHPGDGDFGADPRNLHARRPFALAGL